MKSMKTIATVVSLIFIITNIAGCASDPNKKDDKTSSSDGWLTALKVASVVLTGVAGYKAAKAGGTTPTIPSASTYTPPPKATSSTPVTPSTTIYSPDPANTASTQAVGAAGPLPKYNPSSTSTTSTSAGTATSGRKPGEEATQCIQVEEIPSIMYSTKRFKNNCSFKVAVSWCYENGDCKNGNWGFSNLDFIGAASSKVATGFCNGSCSSKKLWFAACKGSDFSTQLVEVAHNQHRCEIF